MPEITINVKCSNDQKYSVTIDTSKTVLEFKQAIAEKSETAADRQRLIYSGKVLKDNDTLENYKIAEGHTVHMVRGSTPNASSQTSQTQTRSQPATTTTGNNTQTPQTNVPNVATNPFTHDSAYGQGGGFNQNIFGGGASPNANPLMDQILQNPAMMQYMQQMLQDPQFVEHMITMNPQFAHMAPQIRQMMQDPEFQAMMSNPETLRNMAALHSLMGSPGIFTGGGAPGFTNPPTTGITNPTTTTAPSETTGTDTTRSITTTGSTPTTTTPITPVNNPFLNMLNPSATPGTGTTNPPIMPIFDPSLLWGYGVPPTTASAIPQVPPEERFQVQLQQLNEMGFYDAQKNIRALQMCQGNVNMAIERLLDPSFF